MCLVQVVNLKLFYQFYKPKQNYLIHTQFLQKIQINKGTVFKFWLIFICEKSQKYSQKRLKNCQKDLRHVPTVPTGSAVHVSSAALDLHVLISRKIQNTSDVRNTSKFSLPSQVQAFFSSLSPSKAKIASKNQFTFFVRINWIYLAWQTLGCGSHGPCPT